MLAAASRLLAPVQTPLTDVPAVMKIAAEARATNARSNVYSIRSCPCSSRMKLRTLSTPFHRVRPQVSRLVPSDLLTAIAAAAENYGATVRTETALTPNERIRRDMSRDMPLKSGTS